MNTVRRIAVREITPQQRCYYVIGTLSDNDSKVEFSAVRNELERGSETSSIVESLACVDGLISGEFTVDSIVLSKSSLYQWYELEDDIFSAICVALHWEDAFVIPNVYDGMEFAVMYRPQP